MQVSYAQNCYMQLNLGYLPFFNPAYFKKLKSTFEETITDKLMFFFRIVNYGFLVSKCSKSFTDYHDINVHCTAHH